MRSMARRMISIFWAMSLLFWATGSLRLRTNTAYLSADELLGQAEYQSIRIRSWQFGFIDNFGKWIIVEHFLSSDFSQCVIVPLVTPLTDAQPVYCEKKYNGNAFSGFIYFRGHERPFCGAEIKSRLPGKCLYINPVTHG